ncbi:MAG: helix-hairpin-helix domain-containing protein [Saprospiraceae bacterium]|nr:helix-hairpin-helix domain-containing protein [Saprospiraceae bacterium]
MKHEYHFTISRSDRICLIVFVTFLLGWELIKYALPPISHDRPWAAENNTFADVMHTTDSMQSNHRFKPSRFDNDLDKGKTQFTPSEDIESLTPIQIMEASWQELRAIGFSSKAASNIQKYIAAGGIVKNEKDLLKIYGMDSAQWMVVSPYVLFPEKKNEYHDQPWSNEKKTASTAILDLNLATSSELEMLPGIGVVLAERIIKYRNSLGGYHYVEQLKECYGLPPETFEKIAPRLTITQPPVTISINNVDYSGFNHPYLNKKMIRLLQAYKSQHGPFTNASDLRKIYPPDSTWCDRLLPYLNFN